MAQGPDGAALGSGYGRGSDRQGGLHLAGPGPRRPAHIKEAQNVAINARRGLRRAKEGASDKASSLVAELERTIDVLEQIVAQTRTRLSGEVPDGSRRVVSLHDTDARPIAKGRLGRPVEFGFKGQVVDNADGIVLDHCIEMGNPPDAPMLAPAIARIKNLLAKTPKIATADRGYGEAKVEAELHSLGVNYVAIPRKGRPGAARQAIESSRRFGQLIKWRTGSEGRISYLKHSWGWERTMLDGIDGARTWCGWGILAHNATKIAVLIDEREMKSTSATSAQNRSMTTKRPSGRPPPPTEKTPA